MKNHNAKVLAIRMGGNLFNRMSMEDLQRYAAYGGYHKDGPWYSFQTLREAIRYLTDPAKFNRFGTAVAFVRYFDTEQYRWEEEKCQVMEEEGGVV